MSSAVILHVFLLPHFPSLYRPHLEVCVGLGLRAAAGGLVQQVAEHVEEEEDGGQVQEREEALVVVQRAAGRKVKGGQGRAWKGKGGQGG